MFRIITLVIVALGCSLCINAQTVKMVNSTMQSWSGGIAGRSGASYTFTIEFSGFKKEPVPDTLWIDRHPIPLIISDNGVTQPNTHRSKTSKKTIRFDISAGTSRDEYKDYYPSPDAPPKAKEPQPPIVYSGVALLSYKYKGRGKYFVIGKIMKVFPPVNYP